MGNTDVEYIGLKSLSFGGPRWLLDVGSWKSQVRFYKPLTAYACNHSILLIDSTKPNVAPNTFCATDVWHIEHIKRDPTLPPGHTQSSTWLWLQTDCLTTAGCTTRICQLYTWDWMNWECAGYKDRLNLLLMTASAAIKTRSKARKETKLLYVWWW